MTNKLDTKPDDQPAENTKRSYFWRTLGIVVTIFIAFRILAEVFSGTYTIELSDIPASLEDRGLGKEAIAIRIRDRVAAMAAQTQTDTQLRAATLDSEIPELKIAGTEIPLRYVANQIRDLIGIPLLKISVSLSESDVNTAAPRSPSESSKLLNTDENPTRFYLALHANHGNEAPAIGKSDSLDELVDFAAFATLKVFDPIIAAAYLRTEGYEDQLRALHIVDEVITNPGKYEKKNWSWRDDNESSRLSRALLMRAYILDSLQNFNEALNAFEIARMQFLKEGAKRGEAYALDGKAYVLIESSEQPFSQKKLDEAGQYLSQALELFPRYDSALYHQAEIFNLHAAQKIDQHQGSKKPITKEDCDVVAKTIADASSAYDIVAVVKPDFTVAYLQKAKLLMKWHGFLLFNANLSAACSDQSATVIESLEGKIDKLFLQAIAYGDSAGDTWVQWGVATREQQVPVTLHNEKDCKERQYLLDLAIFRIKRGSALFSKPNYFAVRMLAYGLSDRSLLGTSSDPSVCNPEDRTRYGEEKAQYEKEALAAACTAYNLTSDMSQRHDLETDFGVSHDSCKGSS